MSLAIGIFRMIVQCQNLHLSSIGLIVLMMLSSEHCQAALTAREKMIIAGGITATIAVGAAVYYLVRNNNDLTEQEWQEIRNMRKRNTQSKNTGYVDTLD
jgi:hypothetical protein